MKKVLFLIALLFTVVCYASPPPEKNSCFATDVGYVIQDIQTVNVAGVNLFAIELPAQEVAFIDIGNTVESLTTLINKEYRYCANKQNTNYGYPFGADSLDSILIQNII